jgi:sugar phosphate isomerase/epimerase
VTAPSVILSAFADEGANSKTAIEQLSTIAAIGLQWYSPRFVDVTGSGTVKHVTELSADELTKLADLHDKYGVKVTSIGARLGKVKLQDVDDGTKNAYIPIKEYLATQVKQTIDVAVALKTKLIRGFSYYHPQGQDPAHYLDEAAGLLKQIVDACAEKGLIYGLEVEANLIGQNGYLLAELAKRVNHPNMVSIYDGGNLSSQNMSPQKCFDEYVAMRDYLGWAHVKDYKIDPTLTWKGHVDEERLKNFVPSDIGDSGHEAIFADLKQHLPTLDAKVKKLGLPGFYLELEPHLKGGGQFGGFSGPDGLGVAARSLCRVLDKVGINYHIRDFQDIKTARGF